jgi:hypothetical protein
MPNTNKDSEQSQMNKRLNDLKYKFEVPCFFISNYFSDLRTKIDYSTEYLIASQFENTDKLNLLRNDFLLKLDEHERLCLNQNNNNKSRSNRFKNLLDELNNINDNNDNNMDRITRIQQIDDLDLKLNKILFLNKTFIFLKDLKNVGSLVIVNEYLNSIVVNLIIK